jgi:WD40 repeat protein
VSASRDRTLKVWNLATGEVEQRLSGHGDAVWGVTVTADGRRAVSASADRTLRIWNLATGEEIARVAVDGAVYCVAVTAGDSERELVVFTGDPAGNVYCFDYVEPGE